MSQKKLNKRRRYGYKFLLEQRQLKFYRFGDISKENPWKLTGKRIMSWRRIRKKDL
jgi:hypothetical protein